MEKDEQGEDNVYFYRYEYDFKEKKLNKFESIIMSESEKVKEESDSAQKEDESKTDLTLSS